MTEAEAETRNQSGACQKSKVVITSACASERLRRPHCCKKILITRSIYLRQTQGPVPLVLDTDMTCALSSCRSFPGSGFVSKYILHLARCIMKRV